MNKSLNIDVIFPWEFGVLIICIGIILIVLGIRQGKKEFNDLSKIPITKPTTKIIFGSAFLLIGAIQTLPLLK